MGRVSAIVAVSINLSDQTVSVRLADGSGHALPYPSEQAANLLSTLLADCKRRPKPADAWPYHPDLLTPLSPDALEDHFPGIGKALRLYQRDKPLTQSQLTTIVRYIQYYLAAPMFRYESRQLADLRDQVAEAMTRDALDRVCKYAQSLGIYPFPWQYPTLPISDVSDP